MLHNNAAATSETLRDDDLASMDVALWDHTMAVNVRGAFLGIKHALPRMLERGGGVIVNTSSGASVAAEPHRIAYSASKGAINRFITGSVHAVDGGITAAVAYTADVQGRGPGIF